MVYVLREDNDETLRIFGDGDPQYEYYRVEMYRGETRLGYDTQAEKTARIYDDDVTRTVDASTLRDVGLSVFYRYGGADPVHGLERIIGSRQDDIITYMQERAVAALDVSISSGRGDDEVFVFGVDGSIDAGQGDDTIVISYGNVCVDGGDGVDVVDVGWAYTLPFDPANLIRTGVSTWEYTQEYLDDDGLVYATYKQVLKNVEVLRVGYDDYIDLTEWNQTAFDDQRPPELASYEEITVDDEVKFEYLDEIFEFDMVGMEAGNGAQEGDVQSQTPQWVPSGTEVSEAMVTEQYWPLGDATMGLLVDDMIWI